VRALRPALHLAWSTWRFWWLRGHAEEIGHNMELILAESEHQPPREAALALAPGGFTSLAGGDRARALPLFERSLPLYRQAGDDLGWALAAATLGHVLSAQNQDQRARAAHANPGRVAAVAAICWQSARLLTSACVDVTSPASPAAASLATAASRPVISTRAPLRANTLAIPLPIPRVPPVTTTDRPAIDVNMALFSQIWIRLASLALAARPSMTALARQTLFDADASFAGAADPGATLRPVR
jgi:hypothetical protein